MPAVTQLYFSGFWLLLCYVWLAIHLGVGIVALVLERRVRRAEGDLRAIEDDDTLQRWGQVSTLTGCPACAHGWRALRLPPVRWSVHSASEMKGAA